MKRHLTDIEIQQYRKRTTPPGDLIAVNDHLFQCDDCFQRFNPNPDLGRAYSSLRAAVILDEASLAEHLTQDEISGHIDGCLNGNEADRCWGHLEICPECREDVEYLTDFKTGSRSRAQSNGYQAPIEIPRRRRLVSDRLRAPLPAWSPRPAYRFGALAVILLAIGFAAGLLATARLRGENARLMAETNRLQGENETLRQSTSGSEQSIAESGMMKPPEDGEDISPPRSDVIVALKDGPAWVQLHKDGGLTGLESAPEHLRDEVRMVLRTGRLEKPRLESLVEQPSVLMGDSHDAAPFSVRGPAGIVVEESQPLFTWTPIAADARYRVAVRDIKSGKVVKSPLTSETRWRATSPLARGRIYSWDVSAILPDGQEIFAPAPPAPVAKFKVVAESDEKRLREAIHLKPQSHVLMAVLYSRTGLMDLARREVQTLVDANPQSRMALGLLQSIQTHGSGLNTP